MTHAESKLLLSEVAGGEIGGARADEVRIHADECDDCGRELASLETTIALCRKAGEERLPEGFSLALHQALVAAGPPPRTLAQRIARAVEDWRTGLGMRPATFAAAAAALACVLSVAGTFAVMHKSAPAKVAAYRVPESKTALVKIDFVAERAVDDVAFEITLPDGLRFVSGGEMLAERTFRFQGKLAAGDNPVPIAVKGPHAGRYKVIAHAIGSALDVTQEVVLEVTS